MKKFLTPKIIFSAFLISMGISRLGHAQEDLIDDTKIRSGPSMSESQAAEAGRLGKLLDELYADCGRYPTTQEGLSSLASKPKTFKCKKWGAKKDGVTPYISSVPKGWKYNSETNGAYNLVPSK